MRLPLLLAASMLAAACGPAAGGGSSALFGAGNQLTLHAAIDARGRDGVMNVELQFPSNQCPALPADLSAEADGTVLLLQNPGGCPPNFRGPLPQGGPQNLALKLKEPAGAATLEARAVYGGRTLTLKSAAAATLRVGEEATVEWQADQFAVLERTTPNLVLRAPGVNDGGALMQVLSMAGSSIRFRVPTIAAGHYKLALDGSVRPTITRCEGAKTCDLVLDASEVAAVTVDVP